MRKSKTIMKKSKTILRSISAIALGLTVFASCDSDDDTNGVIDEDPVVEPIVLDCSTITEATILENRGSGVDYIWPCKIMVEAPLTIEPGVTIAFEQEGGMEIKDYGDRTGSLTAVGTADKPITFTGTNKIAGAWNRIYMNSSDLKNKLHHVVIEYAGGTDGSSSALTVIENSKVEIKHTVVRNSKGTGVEVHIGGNIEGWEANTLTKNEGYPLQIAARKIKFLDGMESSYTDNGTDQIYVNSESIYNRGRIMDEVNGPKHTWLDPGVPFFIDEDIFVRKDVDNEKPGHLQIMEGAEIIFGEEYGLQVKHENTIIEVLGTPANPVTFAGQYGAGSWKGINIQGSNSSLNKIENATISDAGQSVWNWFNQTGGISLGDHTPKTISLAMSNVLITNSAGCGIVERGIKDDSSISYDNVTFSNNSGNDYCEE